MKKNSEHPFHPDLITRRGFMKSSAYTGGALLMETSTKIGLMKSEEQSLRNRKKRTSACATAPLPPPYSSINVQEGISKPLWKRWPTVRRKWDFPIPPTPDGGYGLWPREENPM